jgi:predicted HTH transcriptional regulator
LESETDVTANVPVKTRNVPVKRKDETLKMLLANPKLTAEELAAVFPVSVKTIKRDFAALKNAGRIRRIGSDKAGYWEVIR